MSKRDLALDSLTRICEIQHRRAVYPGVQTNMTGFNSKRQMAADKVLDLDGHVVGKVRKPKREWIGLTPEETSGFTQHEMTVVKYVSKVLQEKNA